jgi:Ca-activated chloride channel family protein
MLKNIEFANPDYLYLLLIVPILVAWYWYKNNHSKAEIKISTTLPFATVTKSPRQYLYHLLFVFRVIVISLLIFALARPQSTSSRQDVTVEGIDIVIALDISTSMLAEDLKPNRLDAAKQVAQDFINGRTNDRFALVVFSGETFTQVPLTTDHSILTNMFKDVKSGMIEDGTALGDGLATAVTRLRESKAISKVIILLTDGVNNMGALDPASAAEIAKIYGIRIYTIGIGSIGMAPYPVQTPFGIQYQNMEVKIDEDILKQVAQMTDGIYFRATNNSKLKAIYDEIDKLEKSKIDVTEFHKKTEEFPILALIAILLFALEILLKNTIFKTTP